jgi:hypothetical protein
LKRRGIHDGWGVGFKQSGYGILNYCRKKIRFGVVQAINSNMKALFRRGRDHKNLGFLLLKAQRMAVTKTEFIVFQKAG